MSELKKLAVSGRAATSVTVPSNSSLENASTRIFARMPTLTLLICDSWTLVLTCIFEISGKLKIFCRSRTWAPSSTWGVLLMNARVGIVGIHHQAVARRP